MNDPDTGPILLQISRIYHTEKNAANEATTQGGSTQSGATEGEAKEGQSMEGEDQSVEDENSSSCAATLGSVSSEPCDHEVSPADWGVLLRITQCSVVQGVEHCYRHH